MDATVTPEVQRQLEMHARMAQDMMRQDGEVGAMYLFSFGRLLMPAPLVFQDEEDKARAAGFARALVRAYWPRSVGFMCEAWMSQSALAAGQRPSQADDRVEVVMLSVATPGDRAHKIQRIRRGASAVWLEPDDNLSGGSWSGRFVDVYPDGPLSADEVLQARRAVAEVVPAEILEKLETCGSMPPTGPLN
jgi:hypothetical protein